MASYVVPLITIPYLARVLGTTGWGLVAFTQGFGAYVAVVGEYGFMFSATREVAQNRGDRNKLANILAGVIAAKTLLAVASVLVAVSVEWVVPEFREHPALFWSGMLWAFGRTFSLTWFFQGLERLRLVSALEVAGQGLATVGIFIFVHSAHDADRVLSLQGAGYLLSFVGSVWLAYGEVAFRLPNWSLAMESLRMGWTMFLFRGSLSLYIAGNAFILGLFASPQTVAYYAGAERISRAFLGVLAPISQALFPRISYMVQNARERAARLARISLMVMGIGGAAMGVAAYVFAPLAVRILLGSQYSPAVPILRILALLPPLIALSNVLGIQWMLPLRLDRAFNSIIVTAGVINLGMATALAPRYAAHGMAWAVVCAEIFVTVGMCIFLRTRKLDPLQQSAKAQGESVLCENGSSS
jgi:PST family polysaccharide transporter